MEQLYEVLDSMIKQIHTQNRITGNLVQWIAENQCNTTDEKVNFFKSIFWDNNELLNHVDDVIKDLYKQNNNVV